MRAALLDLVACALAMAAVTLTPGCGGAAGTAAVPTGVPGPAPQAAVSEARLDGPAALGDVRSTHARLACVGTDLVHAIWQQQDIDAWHILYRRSEDGGRTWSAPARRLSGNRALGDATTPQICTSGDTVHVVWQDTRGGGSAIYLASSLDAGLTWRSEDVRVQRGRGSGDATRPRLSCQGDALWVLWEEDRFGRNRDVYLNYSADGGETWDPRDIRVNRNGDGASDSAAPLLVREGEDLVVAWEDDRNGATDIYANRSADGGRTWLENDRRVERGVPGAATSTLSHMRRFGDRIWITWLDGRRSAPNLASDVYVGRSTTAGATWLGDRRVNVVVGSHDYHCSGARMAGEGTDLHVVWSDERDGLADIYFRRAPSGTTFPEAERRLDRTFAGASVSTAPRIQVSGQVVTVLWQDARVGSLGLFLNRSLDSGTTWQTDDTWVDLDISTGRPPTGQPQQSLDPRTCVGGDELRLIWKDARGGPNEDIYFATRGLRR